MKISQIAIRVHPEMFDEVVANFNTTLGPTYEDKLKMDGFMMGEAARNINLRLAFNHTIMDNCEIEFICSDSDSHWHTELGTYDIFLSHLGIYCESEEEFDHLSKLFGDLSAMSLLQQTISKDHSNKREGDTGKSSRAYRDAVFDTEQIFGFNIKLSLKMR